MDVEPLWLLTVALAVMSLVLGGLVSFLLTRAHYLEIIEELRKKLPG